MTERWVFVEGTNEMYEISDRGNTRSWFNGRWGRLTEPRLLKPGARKGTTPYLIVALTMPNGKMKTHYVHLLVAKHFLPPKPSPKHEIGHGNGNSFDNDYRNLSWVTRKENEAEKRQRLR
ncbi:HNH endonuclease [Mycobacterium avium]|uniref:HNH endonuclease n=1 Tax=Mycobacterium avium TaxID=1764 RepID=UPI001CDA9D76|nr:HNH endonuclease [Mycobacterium avium]MCA2331885.1 HNH endonuclease [Mycobacterium avium]